MASSHAEIPASPRLISQLIPFKMPSGPSSVGTTFSRFSTAINGVSARNYPLLILACFRLALFATLLAAGNATAGGSTSVLVLGDSLPLGGGGRYDTLVSAISGGAPVPAVGAALHSERLLLAAQGRRDEEATIALPVSSARRVTDKLVLAIPSKGRLMEDTIAVLGRAGFVPMPGVRLGVSGADGTWMPHSFERTLPAGHHLRDYHETSLMADAEFARGPFELRGEGIRRRWETTTTGDLDVTSGYVEGRWTLDDGAWQIGRAHV